MTFDELRRVTTHNRENRSIANGAWLMWRVIAAMSPL
jgi:hypothetical protein